jgi:thiol-disulfide isomerase/thioredoxin
MKYTFLALLGLCSLSAAAQSGKYTLKGYIKEHQQPDTVYMFYYQNGEMINDSVPTVKGRFVFNGTLQQPTQVVLMFRAKSPRERNDARQFFLEPGNMTLEAKDSIRYATLKGSKSHTDNELLSQLTKPATERFVALKLAAINTPVNERELPAFKAIEKHYYALVDTLQGLKKDFVKQHPKSFISLETLKALGGAVINYEALYPLYKSLDTSLKVTPLGKEMAKKLAIAKVTGVGVQLADFTSQDTARNALKMYDVVKRGKVTLIDFWASWCGPCRAENPNVVKAFNAFHDKGFNILSVSLDDKLAPWKNAIVKDGMPWYHVSGLQKWNEPAAKLYGIEGVPDNFLVDEEGRVIARGLRGQALYKKLESLLNK